MQFMKTSQSVTIQEFESLEHYILSVDYSRSSTVTKLSWYSISKHSLKIMQRVLPGAVWTDMTNWKCAGKSAVLTHQYSALASGVFVVLRQAWATSIKHVKKRLCPGLHLNVTIYSIWSNIHSAYLQCRLSQILHWPVNATLSQMP